MAEHHDLLHEVQRGLTKPPVSPIPCRGYRISTPDSNDYDCDYANAGHFGCEDCVCNGGAYDPRTGKKYRKRKRGT